MRSFVKSLFEPHNLDILFAILYPQTYPKCKVLAVVGNLNTTCRPGKPTR